MTKGGTVYMMASLNNEASYTGITSDLIARVQEHKSKIRDFSFTSKFCVKLVYYNFFSTIDEAIMEEKRIKGGSRKKKEILINSINPEWKDLWEEIKNW